MRAVGGDTLESARGQATVTSVLAIGARPFIPLDKEVSAGAGAAIEGVYTSPIFGETLIFGTGTGGV